MAGLEGLDYEKHNRVRRKGASVYVRLLSVIDNIDCSIRKPDSETQRKSESRKYPQLCLRVSEETVIT